MKTVILCGGKGTRLREHTEKIPKPLIEIGGKPILWHIMMIYSFFGFKEFILCLGYKGHLIRKYLEKFREWKITFVDTGLETNTGGRIKKIEKYVKDEFFFATYGDGVANINIRNLLEYHKINSRIATITCVRPEFQFGVLEIAKNGVISSFKEKPLLNHWVNGGFFVLNRKVFTYLEENDILERKPFEELVKKGEISGYKFRGFWKCMDTYKDHIFLNDLWQKKEAKWKVW